MTEGHNGTARISKTLMASFALVALAACGGGGGGDASSPPVATVYPHADVSGALTFASTPTGSSSAAQDVTLTNSGTVALAISSISSNDAQFKITGGTCASGGTVPAAASCTVTITFNPTTSGPASGALTFLDNAAVATQAVALSGTGSAVSAINTVRPTSTYVAGTPEKAVFELLNDERGACGFGYLKQAAALDLAAADANLYFGNRAAESISAATAFSHYEDPSKSGFTGVNPSDRVALRGYTGAALDVNEDNNLKGYKPSSSLTNVQLATNGATFLLTTVYHLSGLMGTQTDVGMSFIRTNSADGFDTSRINMDFGVGAGASKQIGSSIRSYPCAGTTSALSTFVPASEDVNPAPDLGSASVGTPIYFNAPEGQTLLLTSVSIAPSAGGTAVTNRILDYSHDAMFVATGTHWIKINESFILPLAPLTAGTAYTVTAAGTSNGAPFAKTFSFIPSAQTF